MKNAKLFIAILVVVILWAHLTFADSRFAPYVNVDCKIESFNSNTHEVEISLQLYRRAGLCDDLSLRFDPRDKAKCLGQSSWDLPLAVGDSLMVDLAITIARDDTSQTTVIITCNSDSLCRDDIRFFFISTGDSCVLYTSGEIGRIRRAAKSTYSSPEHTGGIISEYQRRLQEYTGPKTGSYFREQEPDFMQKGKEHHITLEQMRELEKEQLRGLGIQYLEVDGKKYLRKEGEFKFREGFNKPREDYERLRREARERGESYDHGICYEYKVDLSDQVHFEAVKQEVDTLIVTDEPNIYRIVITRTQFDKLTDQGVELKRFRSESGRDRRYKR